MEEDFGLHASAITVGGNAFVETAGSVTENLNGGVAATNIEPNRKTLEPQPDAPVFVQSSSYGYHVRTCAHRKLAQIMKDVTLAIPKPRLEIWARQGAIETAKRTREAVYRSLTGGLELNPEDYEVYLQGSYGNDTNIRSDSDVDIVAQLNTTFEPDFQHLDSWDAREMATELSDASYTWADFRNDAIAALRSSFGAAAIELANKCIKVAPNSNRLPADVVVAIQLRRYYRDSRHTPIRFAEGIVFYSMNSGHRVINFPKQHYAYGVDKMKPHRTDGRFKAVARVFKNMRNQMIDDEYISEYLAPSYFLQCLVYNAPDRLFGTDLQRTVETILAWYWHLTDEEKSRLRCQNEQSFLFGPTPEQWDRVSADAFVFRALKFWNNWS